MVGVALCMVAVIASLVGVAVVVGDGRRKSADWTMER